MVKTGIVDEVFPEVPARQWVCALPWRLRVLLGYDRGLCAEVLSAFTGALSRSLRHRAKAQLELPSVQDAYVGAITFVQRSDSALRLNVHFHTLALDGVYVRSATGALVFHALGAPTFAQVQQVAQWTHARIEKVLFAHGRTLDGVEDEPAELTHDQPVLASCYAASVADVQLLGESAGQRTLKLVEAVRAVRPEARALAEFDGVNIHAEVAIDGRDRQRLEHVLRYMARPPLALDRLALRDDGQVVYRFKKAWRDGTHAVVLSPEDFIARLCALVPPPRFHLMRYLGVLAGHSSLRAEVVPRKPAALPAQLPLFDERDERDEPTTSAPGSCAPAAHASERRAHAPTDATSDWKSASRRARTARGGGLAAHERRAQHALREGLDGVSAKRSIGVSPPTDKLYFVISAGTVEMRPPTVGGIKIRGIGDGGRRRIRRICPVLLKAWLVQEAGFQLSTSGVWRKKPRRMRDLSPIKLFSRRAGHGCPAARAAARPEP